MSNGYKMTNPDPTLTKQTVVDSYSKHLAAKMKRDMAQLKADEAEMKVKAAEEAHEREEKMANALRGVAKVPASRVNEPHQAPNMSQPQLGLPTPDGPAAGAFTGRDMSGAVSNGTRFGRDFGKLIQDSNTAPNAMAFNMTAPEAQEWNSITEASQGDNQVAGMLELQQNQLRGKLNGTNEKLLKEDELSLAVERVKNNPSLIANYPIYQKSQITNRINNPVTAGQYAKTQEAQANWKKTDNLVSELEKAFEATVPMGDQMDTWLGAAGKYAGEITKFNKEVKAYKGLVAGSISNLARSAFGEKGVLTDFDIARVKEAIPDARTTSRELAKLQFDYIRKINQAMLDGTLSVYGSKDEMLDDIVRDLKAIKDVYDGNNKAPATGNDVKKKGNKYVVEE